MAEQENGSLDLSQSNGEVKAESESEEDCLATLQRTLAQKPPKKSKFEKYGRDITKSLKDELRKIDNPKAKQTTRLYKYQLEAVLKVAEHFSGLSENEERKALIVAPPGSGKSGMVTLIPYALNSKKVLILTPSIIISEQLAADFGHPHGKKVFFVKCGLLPDPNSAMKILEKVHLADQKNMKDISSSNLVIVNAQKFGGRSKSSLSLANTVEEREKMAKQLEEFDTIIVDEAHHYPAATWENVVYAFANKKIVFLTATPFRGTIDKEQELKIFDGTLQVVYKISSQELEGITIRPIEFIDKPIIQIPSILKEENPVGEDVPLPEDTSFFTQVRKDIEEILMKHKAQEIRADHRQAMVLVRTKADAKNVAEKLGPSATYIISDNDGNQNLKDFSEGVKKIAVVCGKLREGYDNANVSLVVILRNCKSRVLFEQFCGRCMRMNRDIQNSTRAEGADKTVGTVLSYTRFKQSVMWSARTKSFAETDPVEENEDEENGSA